MAGRPGSSRSAARRARPSARPSRRGRRARRPCGSRAAGGRGRRSRGRPSRWAGRSATAGPLPGRPIWPVARQRLISAAVLQRPDGRLVGAHRPQRHRRARAREAVRGLLDGSARDAADLRGARRATTRARPRGASSQPLVWRATNGSSTRPSRSTTCSSALSSARSVPGRTGRCRSRPCAVGVARGSAQMTNAPSAWRSRMRDQRIGWQAAVFVPSSSKQSASAMSAYAGGGPSKPNAPRVAGDGGGHAQARVGVDVVRAEEALGELVDRVVVLGQQLAGDVERDRVGPVLVDDRARARPASVPSTSSQPVGSKRASRSSRQSGVVARSGAWTANGRPSGLRQVRPRLTG